MSNPVLSRPIGTTCTACGWSNNKPRIQERRDRFNIVTEGIYTCNRCSAFYHKSIISITPVTQPS